MPRAPRMKLASKVFKSTKVTDKEAKVERLFDAKVEVTEKDAKKVNPLTRFWKGKMTHVYKIGLAHGILLGGLFACAIIGTLSFFGV